MSDISGKIGSLDDLNDDNHLDLVKNEIAEISANEEIVFDDYEESDFDVASASSLDDLSDNNADQFPLDNFEQQVESGAKKGFFASLFRQPEEPLNAVPTGLPGSNAEFNASDLEIISDYSSESEFRADVTETESDSFAETSMVIQGGVGTKISTALVGIIVFTLAVSLFTSSFLTRRALADSVIDAGLVEVTSLTELVRAFFVETVQPLKTAMLSQTIKQTALANLNTYVTAEGNALSQAEITARLEALNTQWKLANDSDPLITSILSSSQNIATGDLKTLVDRFPEYGELFVTDIYGATVAASSRTANYYHANEAWWQNTWSNGKGEIYISQPVYNSTLVSEALLVGFPIKDNQGTLVGIAGGTISVAALAGHVKDFSFGETGYAVLMNNQGKTIVDPGSRLGQYNNNLNESIRQTIVSSAEGSLTSPDDAGESSLFVYKKVIQPESIGSEDSFRNDLMRGVANLDWTLYTRQKGTQAFGILDNILISLAAVGAFSLIIALIISTSISRTITRPIQQLANLSNRVASGDLSKLANVQTTDEVGYLAQSFNTAIQRLRGIVTTEDERDRERAQREELQANVGDFLDVAMDIANGDLTKRGNVSEDVLGNVIDAINLMVEEVAYLLQDVQVAALSVNSGSQEMIQTTEAITQSTVQQTQEAQQATQEVAEVTKSIREMAENAQTSAEASQQAFLASEQGQEAVTNTLGGMQNIRREVQSISKRIKSLGDRSLEISEIVDTISGITRQTNLLALNAAIEASGAGEAGRRFAIVADEVRKLADDSAKATERIAGLIKNVQAEVQEVVISVEDGTREVETGYRVATEAGQRLKEIGDISQRSAQLAQLISQATQAQVEGVEQVGNKVTNIAGIAETSQTNVEQGRDVAQNLQELAEKLAQSLERFRIA